MNRDEIKRIGIEAGISSHAFGLASEEAWQQVERFANLVAAAEREACAQVCDERAAKAPPGSDEQCEADDCAYAIRARGQE